LSGEQDAGKQQPGRNHTRPVDIHLVEDPWIEREREAVPCRGAQVLGEPSGGVGTETYCQNVDDDETEGDRLWAEQASSRGENWIEHSLCPIGGAVEICRVLRWIQVERIHGLHEEELPVVTGTLLKEDIFTEPTVRIVDQLGISLPETNQRRRVPVVVPQN